MSNVDLMTIELEWHEASGNITGVQYLRHSSKDFEYSSFWLHLISNSSDKSQFLFALHVMRYYGVSSYRLNEKEHLYQVFGQEINTLL